jgi:hypothetical protein
MEAGVVAELVPPEPAQAAQAHPASLLLKNFINQEA